MKKIKVDKFKNLSPEEIRKRNEQRELEKKRKEQRATANLERLKEKEKLEKDDKEKDEKKEMIKKEREKVMKEKKEKERKIRAEIEKLRARDKQRRLSDRVVKENLDSVRKDYLERIRKMRESFTSEWKVEYEEDRIKVINMKKKYDDLLKEKNVAPGVLSDAKMDYEQAVDNWEIYQEELKDKIELEEMKINLEMAEAVRVVTQKALDEYPMDSDSDVESLPSISSGMDRDSEVEETDITMVERDTVETEDSDFEGINYMKAKLREVEREYFGGQSGPSKNLTEAELGILEGQPQDEEDGLLKELKDMKEYENYIEEILNIQEEIFEITSSKECKKEVGRNVRREVRKMLSVVLKQQKALIYYRAKYEEVIKNKKEDIQKVSYADKAKKGIDVKLIESTRSRSRSKSRHLVTVYPVKEGLSEFTKTDISRKVDVKEMCGGVKNIRKIQKGGILVEVEKKEDIENLIKSVESNVELKEKYIIRKTIKRQPQIIIFNVDNDYDEKELKEEVIRRNEFMEGEDIIRIRGKYKGRFGNNWIMELRPDIFRKVMKSKKIRIGWQNYNIKENLRPMLCYLCARPGHLARNCKNEKICVICGSKEHHKEECNNEKICVNCKFLNDKLKTKHDLNHDCFDKDCPFYVKEVNKFIERTDYGD